VKEGVESDFDLPLLMEMGGRVFVDLEEWRDA
jgi:hypothetical protein